jgi:hypothetical protein
MTETFFSDAIVSGGVPSQGVARNERRAVVRTKIPAAARNSALEFLNPCLFTDFLLFETRDSAQKMRIFTWQSDACGEVEMFWRARLGYGETQPGPFAACSIVMRNCLAFHGTREYLAKLLTCAALAAQITKWAAGQ